MEKDFEIFTVSSLEKVMPGKRPELVEYENSCFKNEVFSFQVAFRHTKTELLLQNCGWRVSGELASFVKIRPVRCAPCTTACHHGADDYYITHSAALVPEILTDDKTFAVRYADWQSLWITVSGDLPTGRNEFFIALTDGSGDELGSARYTLNVLNALLPRCDLKYAHWFHYDSLAAYERLPVFSPEYNEIMWRYVDNASAHGANVLLVPLFTPPLNTAIRGERLTTQLVDVTADGDEYAFDFKRLKEFMREAQKHGIEYFEMSHLYTQWGAAFAPKIVATVCGKEKRIFGWEDDALGERYVKFIKAFLPALASFLKKEGYGADKCFFHISDEPNADNLPHYFELRKLIKPLLGEYKIIDYDFYKKGAVDIPVVTTDRAHEFAENGVSDFWAYYCCGQGSMWLSNRFMSMPLQRTRILGFQLYLCGCKGFLHWGYNYYNTALSEKYINPYAVTDAGGSFQSGDSFIVYPSDSGTPLDSVRHEVMFDAFQDYRACKLLEQKHGKEFVVSFLTQNGMSRNFSDYPKSALWHSAMRRKLNTVIME